MSIAPEKNRPSPFIPFLVVLSTFGFLACGGSTEAVRETSAAAPGPSQDSTLPSEEDLQAELLKTEALAAQQAAEEKAEVEAKAERERLLAEAEEASRLERQRLADEERQLAQRAAEQEERERLFRERQQLEAERLALAQQQEAVKEQERRTALWEAEVREREEQLAAERAQQEARSETSESIEPEPTSPSESSVEASPTTAMLEAGTLLEIEFLETLSSQTHQVGDRFEAQVSRDVRTDDGILAVPAGSRIRGTVIESRPLRRVGGQASIGVEFEELLVGEGDPIALRASFVELGEDRRKEKRKIIGAAIAGAVLGRVLGGKGAGEVVAGAAVGAAAGTAAVSMKANGKEATIPAGVTVGLVLEEVVTVSGSMTGLAEQ